MHSSAFASSLLRFASATCTYFTISLPVCLSGALRRLLSRGRVARQYAPKEATQLFALLTSRRAVVCLVSPASAALVHRSVHTQSKAFHFGSPSALSALSSVRIEHSSITQQVRSSIPPGVISFLLLRILEVRRALWWCSSSSRCASLLGVVGDYRAQTHTLIARLCTCCAHTSSICPHSYACRALRNTTHP